MSSDDVQALRDALDGLHEARARLDDLLMAGAAPELLELHAAVLSTVKRLLREIDLDERIRRQVRLLRPARPRLHRPDAPRRAAGLRLHRSPHQMRRLRPLPRLPDDRRDKPRPGAR